jgi:predicted O-methyltransferase YrrM
MNAPATLTRPSAASAASAGPPSAAPANPPAAQREPVYLDTLVPVESAVGYGVLGTRGQLGYEGKSVTAGGRAWPHAISTHPPARVRWQLDGGWTSFRCMVALNGDVPAGRSHADFEVLADGVRVAQAYRVTAGAAPRPLVADVTGARTLELVATTTHWDWCHAVWLEPQLDTAPAITATRLVDCLERVDIHLPAEPIIARRCIATTVSPRFEPLLDDMLGSLLAHGGCTDARLVVFAVDAGAECRRIAAKYGAHLVECTRRARVNATVKSVMYSAARVIDAEQFICLDADMLVLGSLEPVFAAMEALPPGSILACREGNSNHFPDVGSIFHTAYCAAPGDLRRVIGEDGGEGAYPLVVNDGIFAGTRGALLALDATIRGWTGAPGWVDQRRDVWWRNQAVFNLALAHLRCGVELDAAYNVQLHVQDAEMRWEAGRMAARWGGRPVRVLHFSGVGRKKYPSFRGHFARVRDPLTGAGAGDGYADFIRALRAWVGRHGKSALAWSFYGTADARNGAVADPSVFPLFGLLHYILRSNGAARVLETGTARGVSAACMASAVAHRTDAAIVTLDLDAPAERELLWDALSPAARACIQPRRGDSLALMDAAIQAGERYDAALLDSLHEEKHVYAEFQRAARLVCPGGLILMHDARYKGGTVDRALLRIEKDGYGVTRLWTADCGTAEDDGLGLAVIENRRRAGGR